MRDERSFNKDVNMKRLTSLKIFACLPFLAFSATQTAQIRLTVVATDPLSYNVRPLPTQSIIRPAQASQQTKASASHQCSKTVYLNQVPYQITATKQPQASYCTVDHLGGRSYGIMMTDR
jgi:hypothetical protein